MVQSLSKVVLTIDLGSTSLRAGLMHIRNTANDRDWIRIPNPNHRYSSRYHGSEWPIKLFLDDENDASRTQKPIWRTGKESHNRLAISAKYAILRLVNDEDLREQYCVVEPLYNNTDPNLESKLRRGLLELFKALRAEVERACIRNRVEVEQIALTIPSQWTNAFQAIYLELVLDAFVGIIEESGVYFLKEVEGIAHYTFRADTPHFLQERPRHGQEMALFLDFGGHSLNHCRYLLKYNDLGGMPNLYLDGEFGGVGGGSEHWEYYILEEYKRRARCGGEPCVLTAETLAKIAKTINNEKRGEIGPGTRSALEIPFCHNGKSSSVVLSHETIMECFQKGFQKPLELAEEQIRLLKEKGGSLVIVTGGSTLHPGVRACISSLCQKAGLGEEPIFMEMSFHNDEAGLKVYMGAAYATAKRITARDFMARGAAFALQRDVEGTEIYPLFSKACPTGKVEFGASGSDDWIIICDPYNGRNLPDLAEAQLADHPAVAFPQPVSFRNSYDVIRLGRVGRGPWTLETSLRDPKDRHEHTRAVGSPEHRCPATDQELCLQIRIWHRPYGSKEKILLRDLFTCLYVNEGSHCAHFRIDDDAETSLRGIFEPNRPPKKETQKKGRGKSSKRGRGRRGFRGTPAHLMRASRQCEPERSSSVGDPGAEPDLANQGSPLNAPEMTGTDHCTSSETQPLSFHSDQVASRRTPATRYGVAAENTGTWFPDHTPSSWFKTSEDPLEQDSSHEDFTTSACAVSRDNALNSRETNDLEDDFGIDPMSLMGDCHNIAANNTSISRTEAYVYDETFFVPDASLDSNHASDDAASINTTRNHRNRNVERDFNPSSHAHTLRNVPSVPSAQRASDMALEFTHLAPKYRPERQASRVPEAPMEAQPSASSYEQMLRAQFAQSASPNPPSSGASILPPRLSSTPTNPATTTITNPSSVLDPPHPRLTTDPSTTSTTRGPMAERPTTARRHPLAASTSYTVDVDLTVSPPQPDQQRRVKSKHAICGGRGGKAGSGVGRGGGGVAEKTQRPPQKRPASTTANPMRPIKH